MPRDYRLINFNGEWQVCSKARRGHGERIVWIYGKERIFFCDVGGEAAVYVLPGSEKENFFGDRFNYSIDEVYPEDGRRMERLGGMNNVVAAQRAFTELLSHHSKRTRLQLRQGSFVMRDEFGKDDYKERVQIEAEERRRLKEGAAKPLASDRQLSLSHPKFHRIRIMPAIPHQNQEWA